MKREKIFNIPSGSMEGNDLLNLLEKNNLVIEQSKNILQKVLDRLFVKEKVIFLCDENGYIINIIGEMINVQYFFEQGLKIGVSMLKNEIGNNAVKQVLINEDLSIVKLCEHGIKELQSWTSIAVPIVLDKKIMNIICILIKIDKQNNQCKLIMELIRDYITILLKQCYEDKVDKSRFFGSLILDNHFNFTPKEIEILYHLSFGKKVGELSSTLHVSNNTIKTHLKNIYSKMNVSNSKECISFLDNYFKKYID